MVKIVQVKSCSVTVFFALWHLLVVIEAFTDCNSKWSGNTPYLATKLSLNKFDLVQFNNFIFSFSFVSGVEWLLSAFLARVFPNKIWDLRKFIFNVHIRGSMNRGLSKFFKVKLWSTFLAIKLYFKLYFKAWL